MAERSREVPLVLLDVAIGTAVSGLGGLARGRRAVSRLAAPVTGPAAWAARAVGDRLPAVLDGPLRATGQARRAAARATAESWLGYLVPRLVAAVLDRLDLTELVVQRVDLDRVAGRLDVEAVLDRLDLTELVIRRVDLDRVAAALDVEAVLDRLDLTELVIRRVDLDRVAAGLDVEAVLDRLDLTELVIQRVDLNRVAAALDVEAVLDRLDLTELVVSRVDLDRVAARLDVEAVLDRLDLTELVVSRVDLDRIARALDLEAIAYRLDLNALAARIDLIGLAEQVVVGIDLPQLIRDSTGSVASEGVAGVRMQGMEADQALAHLVDRVLRRRPRRPQPEQGPDSQRPVGEDTAALLDGQAR